MDKNQLQLEFNAICQKIISLDTPYASEPDLEPAYEVLLNFLIENQESESELVKYINAVIYSYREPEPNLLTDMAIQYCMHILRWQGVYDFVESEIKEFYSKKLTNKMSGFLDAYNDDWEDKFFFCRLEHYQQNQEMNQ